MDTNETLLGVRRRCLWLASNLQRLRETIEHSKMLVKFNIIGVPSKDIIDKWTQSQGRTFVGASCVVVNIESRIEHLCELANTCLVD